MNNEEPQTRTHRPGRPAPYLSFNALHQNEVEGVDYRIRHRRGTTGILVMAPHGGNIEPGTSPIADAAAGNAHSFYAFEGLKPGRNSDLHLTSHCFDEPTGCRMAADADTVLTIHGCNDRDSLVFVGGLDRGLAGRIWDALERDGFTPGRNGRIPGEHPDNICNRCRSGMGVQLEVSAGLRKRMFTYHPGREPERTALFHDFVLALKSALPKGG